MLQAINVHKSFGKTGVLKGVSVRVSRGEVDTERMARVLLDEYRSCKLGTVTLERPEELQ